MRVKITFADQPIYVSLDMYPDFWHRRTSSSGYRPASRAAIRLTSCGSSPQHGCCISHYISHFTYSLLEKQEKNALTNCHYSVRISPEFEVIFVKCKALGEEAEQCVKSSRGDSKAGTL